jgi:hypothetical protein
VCANKHPGEVNDTLTQLASDFTSGESLGPVAQDRAWPDFGGDGQAVLSLEFLGRQRSVHDVDAGSKPDSPSRPWLKCALFASLTN